MNSFFSSKHFILLMATLMGFTAFMIDSILPAFPAMTRFYGLSDANAIHNVVFAYFLGNASTQLLFGLLGDSLGRKKTLLLGFAIYIGASLSLVFTRDFSYLLLGRFLQGAGLAAPRVMVQAIVRDVSAGNRMAQTMSYIMMVFMAVPVLAPSFGQLILKLGDFKTIFHFYWLTGLLVLLWFDAALWLLMSHNERFERINALILRAARFQAAPLWLRPFAAVAAGMAWLLLLPAYAARAVLLNAHGRMLGCTALALTLLVPLLPLLPSGHPHNMLLAYPTLLLVAWLRLLLGDGLVGVVVLNVDDLDAGRVLGDPVAEALLAVLPGHRDDPGGGGGRPVPGGVHLLEDHELGGGPGRDLGQVRDDDHLVAARQAGQAPPHLQGRPAADTGVDLVEDEGAAVSRAPAPRLLRVRLTLGQDDLQGQHDPAELTARGPLAQGQGGGAGVGGQQQGDRLGAGGPGLGQGRELDDQASPAHLKALQLGGDGRLQLLGQLLAGPGQVGAQPAPGVLRAVELVQAGAGLPPPGQQGVHVLQLLGPADPLAGAP